ncbi:hypothetical protein CYMTET_8491 [Cymbomonas tetramitiformis]|uniref:Uncharacterized protein n=1 Tax=Cymbomonas tetramitiformis TaxID=36881 RepID=A0AAE0LFT0_9CHLO|nr:hypothetical protein CYMTET_8491 [Cymbomonas tetramitiformis]
MVGDNEMAIYGMVTVKHNPEPFVFALPHQDECEIPFVDIPVNNVLPMPTQNDGKKNKTQNKKKDADRFVAFGAVLMDKMRTFSSDLEESLTHP